MVSKASEDFPEPDNPVNTTSLSLGISTSTFFRLCSRAPRMVIARRLEADWRRAFKISSMSAFPGAGKRGKRRVAGKRSDASGHARNIGRTGINFQCCVKTINRLFRDIGKSWSDGSSGQQSPNKKGRHEAGLFENLCA